MIECNADLDRPCDANNGEPCDSCAANEAYWLAEWNAYGRQEVAERMTVEDINSCYSELCESAKREGMLRMIEKELL